jgi:hypothetical protein
LPQTHPSLSRRWVFLGVLVAAGAILVVVATTGGGAPVPALHGGDVSGCARLKGDVARDCYSREVGRELVAVGATGAPRITFAAPAGTGTEVTFTAAADTQPLLCDLHTRVGVVNADVPSWVEWTEPAAAQAAPVS